MGRRAESEICTQGGAVNEGEKVRQNKGGSMYIYVYGRERERLRREEALSVSSWRDFLSELHRSVPLSREQRLGGCSCCCRREVARPRNRRRRGLDSFFLLLFFLIKSLEWVFAGMDRRVVLYAGTLISPVCFGAPRFRDFFNDGIINVML